MAYGLWLMAYELRIKVDDLQLKA